MRSVLFVFVMLKGIHSICDDSQHECDNGSKCVLSQWVCDGDYDCLDKSDEMECDQQCEDEEFTCASSPQTCLPQDWLCDGEFDCDDKSDEAQCSTIVCSSGRFSCGANVSCIPDSLLCDGHPDCPSGLDESADTCLNRTACHADEFQCVSNKHCISKRWVCDSDYDCLDHSDEANCPSTTCAASDWQCSDSQCIPSKWHCDGSFDCRDHSDESDCPMSPDDMSSKHCSENEFYCRKSHECIRKSWVCDASADCEDETDEDKIICGVVTCQPNHFQCVTTGNCIPALLKCDGIRHCNDGSDESEDICTDGVDVHTCNPQTEFDCSFGDSGQCVPLDVICDGKMDCSGGEDETRVFCSSSMHDSNMTNVCEKINGGCSHNCIPTHLGYYCSCQEGFYLAEDNKVCEDIDECLEPDTCSQVCHNRPGGYKCSCHHGYELDPSDHITCRAKGGEPVMIFSNKHDLRQIHLFTGRYRPLLEDVNSAVAVDYDLEARTLYWSDVTSENISRVIYDDRGSLVQMETIVSDDVRIPDGLAYDWIHKNLYWTDTGNDRIDVLSLKSSRWRRTLISTDLDEPRAIIVDPREKHRMLYWTDWGEKPKIERAYLDGSSRQTLISTSIVWPNGLTIDCETDRLYWVDAKLHIIASSDLDGGQRRVILTSYGFLQHPFAVAVFEDDVYWTDWHTQSILKASKHHSKANSTDSEVVRVADDLSRPLDLHIYHALKQPAGEDICHDRCSHMCLPRPGIPGYTCLCPLGASSEFTYVLDLGDRRTCIHQKIDADGLINGKSPAGNATVKNVEMAKVGKSEEPMKPGHQMRAVILASAIATIVFLVIAAAAVCFLVKMHRRKNIKTMNFDNPVYRKTTEEQFCLEKSFHHSGRQVPVLLEPLTAPIHGAV